jgi:DNA invertase Pin-like site-specific DNA recombinase
MRTIGYLRVSCSSQDLEKNKAEILSFANGRKLVPVEWRTETISGTVDWRKREIGRVLAELKPGDTIITSEISRLARSMKGVIEIVEAAKLKELNLHSIKGNWSLNGNMESKVVLYMLALFGEIERDLISRRTAEALRARKQAGVKLGRPKGPGKSKLDQFKPEIEALLKNGSAKAFVARRYGVSEATLYNWLAKNQIDAAPRIERVTA